MEDSLELIALVRRDGKVVHLSTLFNEVDGSNYVADKLEELARQIRREGQKLPFSIY